MCINIRSCVKCVRVCLLCSSLFIYLLTPSNRNQKQCCCSRIRRLNSNPADLTKREGKHPMGNSNMKWISDFGTPLESQHVTMATLQIVRPTLFNLAWSNLIVLIQSHLYLIFLSARLNNLKLAKMILGAPNVLRQRSPWKFTLNAWGGNRWVLHSQLRNLQLKL